METLTKENVTETKTFKSGFGVKVCKYWKNEAHWYRIIKGYDVIIIYIDGKSASIDRNVFEGIKHWVVEILTSTDRHHFKESTKEEFLKAYKKALKIINQ